MSNEVALPARSYLDRAKKESWKRFGYAGFDPDLHSSGFAVVTIDRSNLNRKKLITCYVRDIQISKNLRGLEATHKMIKQVVDHLEVFVPLNHPVTEILIESQQVYFEKDENRAKIVSIANDLMLLATISGAVAGFFYQQKGRPAVNIKLPAEWKAQRRKENMHARALNLVKEEAGSGLVDKISIHALDALCMALVQAGYKV